MKIRISIERVILICFWMLLCVKVNAQHATTFKFNETAPSQVLRVMEKNANALFAEIHRKYDLDQSNLELSSVVSSEAEKRITTMWGISHFYCSRAGIFIQRVLKVVGGDSYQVRDIPVCFKEGESDEYKYRNVVLEFNRYGKITDFYCALPKHDIQRADGNPVTNLRHKEMINSFVNNFFTAYNCKDLDLIEKMYSEDALIITGRVVNYKTNKNSELSRSLTTDPKIEYSIQNKKEYLTKLSGIFSRNAYINIKFDGVEIIQSEANPKIYGVRLNQYWHVSRKAGIKGYYDEGKLFLVIDFTNEDRPEIWVRTWQPFQDANGKRIQYSEEDFFSIGDFTIE